MQKNLEYGADPYKQQAEVYYMLPTWTGPTRNRA